MSCGPRVAARSGPAAALEPFIGTTTHPPRGFSGKTVAVIGRGQSALETAALLHAAGSPTVHVLVPSPAVVRAGPPPPPNPELSPQAANTSLTAGRRLDTILHHALACAGRTATSPIAIAWRGCKKILGPFGAWWLKSRVEDIRPPPPDHGGGCRSARRRGTTRPRRGRSLTRHSSTWTTSYPQPATASTCDPWTSSPTSSRPRSKRSKDPPD